MGGLREVLPLIPPVLLAQWSIANPTTALAECRIMGSNDATYGTVGWTPRLDGQPFCVISWADDTDDESQETWFVHATWKVELFLAVAHASDPSLVENFNDLALAWSDASRLVIASNRRLSPSADNLVQNVGDLRWRRTGATNVPSRALLGTPFAGVSIMTELQLTVAVQYQ